MAVWGHFGGGVRVDPRGAIARGEAYAEAAWPVEAAGALRCFRIRITGGNAVHGFELACAGIELYGTLG